MNDSGVARLFVCGACGRAHQKWAARCPSCLLVKGLELQIAPTNSEEEPEAPPSFVKVSAPTPPASLPPRPKVVRAPASKIPEPDHAEELGAFESPAPIPISEIEESTFIRDSTNLPPLDQVLGGGLVTASVILLASPPGIGKTSLTLQMMVGLGHRCLYATGEETVEQVAATARRIGAVSNNLFVLAETNIAKIFAHARTLRAQTIAMDSIQKMACEDISSRAGSAVQVKACVEFSVRYAKSNNTAVWIIGQVTSDGDVAGPKALEHDVDTVLELVRGDEFGGNERILRCPSKNRFGATNVTGRFQLTSRGFIPVDLDGWNGPL